MNTKELYLRAERDRALTVNEFLDRLHTCIRRLGNRYPLSLLTGGATPTLPSTLEEPINLDVAYVPALLQGILAEGSGETGALTRFYAEADAAYIALWRKAARGRQLGRKGGDA